MEKGVITVSSITDPDQKISINLTRGSTEIEPFFNGKDIWFNVKIKMEGNLWEQQSTEDLSNPKIFKSIEEEMSRAIEARTRAVLEKAQLDYGVDIFAFGEAFHRKYKKEWAKIKNHWNEEFSNAGAAIAVEAHIRRTGITINRISEE